MSNPFNISPEAVAAFDQRKVEALGAITLMMKEYEELKERVGEVSAITAFSISFGTQPSTALLSMLISMMLHSSNASHPFAMPGVE